ncbi:2615_t:CDS:2, partial [Cetraspora pellucida]
RLCTAGSPHPYLLRCPENWIKKRKREYKKGVKMDLVLYLFVLVINMFFFDLQTGSWKRGHLYCCPPVLDNLIDNLAKAIGYSFKEYVHFVESFKRKILGNSESERSSWSRAEKMPIVIEDLTSEEAFTYLHSKLGIEKKVTNQLIQLLGGRIRNLQEYGNMINRGMTFENVYKIVLGAVDDNFHQAQMMEGEEIMSLARSSSKS